MRQLLVLVSILLCASPLWGGVSDTDFVELDCVSTPLDKDTSFTLLVSLSTKTTVNGIVIPLTFAGNANLTVDTTVGTKGITQQTLGAHAAWNMKGATVNNTAKTILIYYVSFSSSLPPSTGPLVRIHFKLLATADEDVVDVDSALIAPANHLAISDLSAVTHTPQFTKGRIAIGSICPSQSVPEVLNLRVGYPEAQGHITTEVPQIEWAYFDEASLAQTAFEVECGTDDDWGTAELWQTGLVSGADTAVTYGGLALQDGGTYFCRVRVTNGMNNSEWLGTSFHMNSPATWPVLAAPIADALTFSLTPTLTIVNAADADGDPLVYEFHVYADSSLLIPLSDVTGVAPGVGQTAWTAGTLPDNSRVWWHARAYDGYEYGYWSFQESFWIDGVPELPSSVELISPPDGSGAERTGTVFAWHPASDPDPFDTLAYRLQFGFDEAFLSSTTFDAVPETTFTPPEPLTGGTLYFWRVFCLDRRSSDSSVSSVFDFTVILPGDMNGDGRITSADVIRLVNYTFKGGLPPDPVYIGDVNADCKITSSDIIYLVNFVFKGGVAPLRGCAQ